MARLSVTATATAFLAAVAFFVAAGVAEAGPSHNGDAITKDFIFARGIKLHIAKQGTEAAHVFAQGTKLSIAKHDAAAGHVFAQGTKLSVAKHDAAAGHVSARGSKLDVTQSKIGIPLSKVSVPKSRLAVSESKVSIPEKDTVLAEGRKLAGASADTTGAAPGALQACDQLEAYQRVCHTLLHMPGVTTPRTLLETAVRVALGRARSAKVAFDAAMAASKVGNPMASILGSCDQNYDDLVDALEKVSRAMQKPGATAQSLVDKISTASTYAGDCDNWYEERNVKSPFEVMQRHLAQMVSVALGLANKIKL